MPLVNTASTQENSAERLTRLKARNAAEGFLGKCQLLGKEVHHKNGDNKDNRECNLTVLTKRQHGKEHGRGHGKRGKR